MSHAAPHVVIIGGGFAGLEVARRLRSAQHCRITLVDRQNYHLFQPLLYQVATGGLSPSNIATPLRYILRKQKNCCVLLDEVMGIDVAGRLVVLREAQLDFDILVVAAGARTSYFGHDDWEADAPGLKGLDDATDMRRRIFIAFETAERLALVEDDDASRAARNAWMTFVIVGGGPTGVELAGTLAEIAQNTLRSDFRSIKSTDARIILVEASPRILDQFPENLSVYAHKHLMKLGVEIITDARAEEIDAHAVMARHDNSLMKIETRTVLWAAGVRAHPLSASLARAAGVEPDRMGRVPVTETLTLPGHEHVFVIGDMARACDEAGAPLPGLAPVAIQQGRYTARLIAQHVAGRPHTPKPFRYRDRGMMAAVGRGAAIAVIGKRTFRGFVAWLLWLFIHLMLLVQFQNRVLVLLQWAWNYITFSRSSRLILPPHADRTEE
ncbi:MAG: NAD(P)/FAD-dependent oxidoreductase [Phycisphaerales bacterium]